MSKKKTKKGRKVLKTKIPVKKYINDSGGVHSHWFGKEFDESCVDIAVSNEDGAHNHLFIIGGLPFETCYDGEHTHEYNPVTNRTGPELTPHTHRLKYGGVEYTVEPAGPHMHELQRNSTTYSGLHRHAVTIGEEKYFSILPGDLMQADVRKRVQLEVQCVHISNLLFPDEQEATQFVEDRGFVSRDCQKLENGYRYRQLSRDRFKQETLKELELSDGVKAVVGIIDPDKMGDTNLTFDSIKDINPEEQMLKDDQAMQLARLKDVYNEMVNDLKEKTLKFIPILNQFVELSDEFLKNESFQVFLTEFIDGFNVLQGEMEKVETPNFTVSEKSVGNFEDSVRSIQPILKSLTDVFLECEGFENFGRLLKYNELMFKQMILNIPMIRSEGIGTPIEKTFNTSIDLLTIGADELEHLVRKDIASLDIKPIEIEKLENSDELQHNLSKLLEKFKSDDEEIKIDLGCGDSKEADFIGIDKHRQNGVDLCYNLDNGIPLPSASVDKVRAANIFEYLGDREMIIEQAARVLKTGGILEINAPATNGENAFLPCYKSLWNHTVIKYLAGDKLEVLDSSTEINQDTNFATVKVKLKKL